MAQVWATQITKFPHGSTAVTCTAYDITTGLVVAGVVVVLAVTEDTPGVYAAVLSLPTGITPKFLWSANTNPNEERYDYRPQAIGGAPAVLVPGGLDLVSTAEVPGVAVTFRDMMRDLWWDAYGAADLSPTQRRRFRSDGTTVKTTQAVTLSTNLETQGAAQ